MFLDEVLAVKQQEIATSRTAVPLSELERRIAGQAPALDFAAALNGSDVSLIAEIKRSSPSKGPLRSDLAAARTALNYAVGGANAISVLTDKFYFGGSLADLSDAKAALAGFSRPVPVLRKDFIISPYQVYESRACGADAILLIVAALADTELSHLLRLAHSLGMKCLVETHDEEELQRAVRLRTQIIGINNRDLHTLQVDIRTTQRLAHLIPKDHILVSESGIRTRHDIHFVSKCGARAVLVGEALVSAVDCGEKICELMNT